MTWQLLIVGLAGLAVGLAASYAWRGFTLDATWALVVEAWEDLTNVRRQLAAAEADLKTAQMDAATHKARADAMEARASAVALSGSVREVGWIVELPRKAKWVSGENACSWDRNDAMIFDRREDGAQWIVDFGGTWEPWFSVHLMVVVAVDRETREPIESQDDAVAISAPPTPEPYIVPPDQTDADARKRPKGTLYAVRLTEPDGEVTYWPPAAGIYRINNLSRARKYGHAAEAFELRAAAIAQAIWCVEAHGDVMDVVAIPPGYVEATR